MSPWEQLEASTFFEPVDCVPVYLPLYGESYRHGVTFNSLERYPEAIHFIASVGRGVDPSLFGAKLDARSSQAESDRWKLIILCEADYEKLQLPNPNRIFQQRLREGQRAVLQRYPKQVLERYGAWEVSISGPLDLASRLRGYDMLLIDMYRYPASVHRLFEQITNANVE